MGGLPNELFPTPRTPNRGVVNRRPQIEHTMKRPDHHCGDDLVVVI